MCAVLSLHCSFCVALPFSHHPYHQPHLNPRPCLEAAAHRDSFTTCFFFPSGLPEAPVPPCLRHSSYTFCMRENCMFVCLPPLLDCVHFEGPLHSPVPSVILANMDVWAYSLTLHLETIGRGKDPSIYLFLNFNFCVGDTSFYVFI